MSTPHWLTGGFRPFFFLGAVAMAGSVLAWLPLLLAGMDLPTAFAARDWHIHTMLFGGVMAIVAGFALTAVANWTGRPPVAGGLLLALVSAWLAGRFAVSTSAWIGLGPAAMIDLAFPCALAVVFAREVIAARNWRNLRVVAVVAALGAADLAFHVEAAVSGRADHAARASIALVLVLVMLIGGRIIPAFTRNWLATRRAVRLPSAHSVLDSASMALAMVALAAWTVAPAHPLTATLLVAAGIAAVVRLARWRGWATRSEPLLLILHVAFATIPLGFAAVATSILDPSAVDPAAAVHVWAVGTFGTITLAVMTRASRGHSGRPLTAGPLECAIFALVLAGFTARVLAPEAGEAWAGALELAGLAWAGAYLLFAIGYAPMLFRRSRAGAG